MTCREFWDRMPELETGGEPLEHVRDCPHCAARLEQQRAVSIGLRRLARYQDGGQGPAGLESRLLEAFRNPGAVPAPVRGSTVWPRRSAQIAAAASVMLLAVGLLWHRPPQPIAPVATPEITAESVESDSDFIPLPYAAEDRPVEDAHLIRVEMPRSALVALGVPVTDGEASEPVEAEVLLGLGGTPQAVRVLQ